MAVPDREVDIVKLGDVQTAIDRKNDTVLLIFKDVASAYTVYKNGLQLPELNVGAVQNSAQRKAVVHGVALTVEECKISTNHSPGDPIHQTHCHRHDNQLCTTHNNLTLPFIISASFQSIQDLPDHFPVSAAGTRLHPPPSFRLIFRILQR